VTARPTVERAGGARGPQRRPRGVDLEVVVPDHRRDRATGLDTGRVPAGLGEAEALADRGEEHGTGLRRRRQFPTGPAEPGRLGHLGVVRQQVRSALRRVRRGTPTRHHESTQDPAAPDLLQPRHLVLHERAEAVSEQDGRPLVEGRDRRSETTITPKADARHSHRGRRGRGAVDKVEVWQVKTTSPGDSR